MVPTNSLSSLVSEYINYFRSDLDKRLSFYVNQCFKECVKFAAFGINEGGKKNHHQWRIRCDALKQFYNSLRRRITYLETAKSFEELHSIIAKAKKDWIGPLTIYDTALHIGAKLGLVPSKVYLHAGALEGAKFFKLYKGRNYLEMHELLIDLQKLKPYEVENFLCIYKKGKLLHRNGKKYC